MLKCSKEETLEVTKNKVIDAPPEVVFNYLITDQNQLTNWFPDQAILETKVGGKMKFRIRRLGCSHIRAIAHRENGTLSAQQRRTVHSSDSGSNQQQSSYKKLPPTTYSRSFVYRI